MPRYSKSYKKTVAASLGQPNLLFDSLVKSDNTKHPTAAKSTGKVGKWGITSFTSLRHIKAQKHEPPPSLEDTYSTKRLKTENVPSKSVLPSKDQYIYNFESPLKSPIPKPVSKRKFFKSRNNDLENAGKAPPERTNYELNSNKLVNSEAKENTDFGRFVLKAKIDQRDGKKHYSIEPPKLKSDNSIGLNLDYQNEDLDYDNCEIPYESDTALRTRMKLKRFFASPMSYSVQSDPSDESSNPESGLSDSKSSYSPCKDQSNDGSHADNSNDNQDGFWDNQQPDLQQDSFRSTSPCSLRQPETIEEKGQEVLNKPLTMDSNQGLSQELNDLWSQLSDDPGRTFQPLSTSTYCNKVAPSDCTQNSTNETLDRVPKNDENSVQAFENPDSGVYTQNSDLVDYVNHSESQELPINVSNPIPSSLQTQESSANTKSKRIFQSRKDNSTKKATYRHKWHNEVEDPVSDQSNGKHKSSTSAAKAFEFDDISDKLVFSTAKVSVKSDDSFDKEAVTKVKCNRESKMYYQVVKNVKKAHQIQESGEYQEFNDDVEYLLDSLQKENNIITRCLSSVSLASKCMVPAFRMHLRAHGTVIKFFSALHDAPQHPSLALCTSLVMFILSQDRLNIDLDPESLYLMLQLLDSDASHTKSLEGSKDLDKTRQKVVELCSEMKTAGHAKQLNFDRITAGHLAMESLLSLTSKRAGEWFKEEMRELGGLDHIVSTVKDCMNCICPNQEWNIESADKLRKIDRCLRVLENVLNRNEENQLYLLKHEDGILLKLLMNLYKLCTNELPLNPVTGFEPRDYIGWTLAESLFTVLKVLTNMTHDFDSRCLGSTVCGQHKDIFYLSLQCLFVTPEYLHEDKKFDLYVLGLGLLINLVENSQENRELLLHTEVPERPDDISDVKINSILDALIDLFFLKQESARIQEAKTDKILDGKKDEDEPEAEDIPKSQEEYVEETVAKLLQKAGKHMEDTLVAAYTSILLGLLMLEDLDTQIKIRDLLPDKSFTCLLEVLKKLLSFMKMTATEITSSSEIMKAMERVIRFMENLDKPVECKVDHLEETTFMESNTEDSVCLDTTIEHDFSLFN